MRLVYWIIAIFTLTIILSLLFGGTIKAEDNYRANAINFCEHYNMTAEQGFFIGELNIYCYRIENDTLIEKRELIQLNGLWAFKER